RAVKCRNRCRHCYVSAGTVPFEHRVSATDILDITKKLSRMCTRKKNVFLFLHDDPFDYLDIESVIEKLWQKGFRSCLTAFPTHGAGILQWDDPSRRLRQLREYGVKTFQFTFHGLEEEHDWFVQRKGAFRKTMEVATLCIAAEFDVYWAVFVNTRNLADIPGLLKLLDQRSGENRTKLFLGTWTHSGSAIESEHLRPTIKQYESLPSALGDRLPKVHTEAYWVERAIAGDIAKFPRWQRSSLELSISETGVVTHAHSDNDAEIGKISQPLEVTVAKYLRTRSTLRTILAKRDKKALRGLANRHGDAQSEKVHTSLSAVRCWLARRRKSGGTAHVGS
ncbi:MAG TPA: radical SAM protein, partial [Candidatus Hydrogenedentes bacterium]|nr:radical SAM protein [Candidatus Hydrogenedentota bacterium]